MIIILTEVLDKSLKKSNTCYCYWMFIFIGTNSPPNPTTAIIKGVVRYYHGAIRMSIPTGTSQQCPLLLTGAVE